MSLSKVLSLALVVGVASASQALNNPSRVIRRDPPAPSAFPLGKACDHEWQYLNFNPTNDIDKAHLQKLHDVICEGEMRTISSHGQVAAQGVNVAYKRYFPKSDEEDDYQTHVTDVLRLIAGTSSSDGWIGGIVGTFVVDNLDFAANQPDETDCTDEGTLAYTLTDQLDGREKIHFCDPSWTRGNAYLVDCASLDLFPSSKMDAFSRIVLHEMLHYTSVGPDTSLAAQITDVRNNDGEFAYEPERVHGLLDPAQDDQIALPEINADSYAWMSLESFISRKCLGFDKPPERESFFVQDPPPYEPLR